MGHLSYRSRQQQHLLYIILIKMCALCRETIIGRLESAVKVGPDKYTYVKRHGRRSGPGITMPP